MAWLNLCFVSVAFAFHLKTVFDHLFTAFDSDKLKEPRWFKIVFEYFLIVT